MSIRATYVLQSVTPMGSRIDLIEYESASEVEAWGSGYVQGLKESGTLSPDFTFEVVEYEGSEGDRVEVSRSVLG